MSHLNVGLGSSYGESMGSGLKNSNPNTKRVLLGCNVLCAGQIIGAVFLALLSYLYLFGYMLLTGLMVGGVLAGAGAVGILGNVRKNRDLMNFHVVGAILGLVLCSNFCGQVWREVSVDCALSDLFIRTERLDELGKTLAMHDMFDLVNHRMNEVEEMLEVVNYGVHSTISILQDNPDEDRMAQERRFLRHRLDIMRQHAESVIDEIENNPNATHAKQEKWSEEDRENLKKKLHTAEHILERIAKHDDEDEKHEFTPEDYEHLLNALINLINMPTVPGKIEKEVDDKNLIDLANEMDETKSVIGRLQKDVDELDGLKKQTAELTESSRRRREEAINDFKNLLKESRDESNRDLATHSLEYMPEHCVEESQMIPYLGILGLSVASMQLVTVYISLCMSFRIPIKVD